MSNQSTFHSVSEKHLALLNQYVPIVAKVHGGHHPEFHRVNEVFDVLDRKIKAAGLEKPVLDEEFIVLRRITNDYAVPSDTCETYEAGYKMLYEMDQAYHGKI